jgi:hypothetical protein
VSPFQIIGGHLSITSPQANISIIAADLSNGTVQHAVFVGLKNITTGVTGDTLYQTHLGQVATGTNPFTGNSDIVTHITDLLLYNRGVATIHFDDDSELSMTVISK